ncbi:efflux RND transporter permease subunit [Aeromonas schubertii]|uniref:efflux RND transporter permease subunit n=1 Tax=Aeromonas schubertii TaxID=652 RepID=UPI0010A7D92D|nr:CusA/CzcA family heavy metal efflux RND transporter [Aeromonas schubertii]QCG46541.1 efflux RND transporter permease subunit [Aeromonas schubertii]
MIAAIIRWSLGNRFLVLLVTLLVTAWGIWSVRQTPVDALPDLSDVQVIIKTSYPGQAPQVVEDQVTYPLTTALLAVPGATTVRGYSFFGDSFVYVLFDDKTDLYWARARVLEYLSQVASRLPPEAKPELGPDATGVGWVYQYALVDKSGKHDLAQLTSLQNWFLKYELQTVPGVSEVATVGGMVKQYQVRVDPDKLRAYGVPLSLIKSAIEAGNQETGASVIEMAEAEYMVRSNGYLKGVEDLRLIPLGTRVRGTPLTLGDVAEIGTGPQMRRGVAELNGEGEVVGGIIVMRYGENAQQTIDGVKARLAELTSSLPEGVELVTVYDRSDLIQRAIDNLSGKLVEEFVVVVLVCLAFLFHLRSSLVVVVSLPIAILVAFIVMHLQGINANIMSLGGIAIAIGAMVDGAIVMIENVHKHMERTTLTDQNRWQVIQQASIEVGPAIFFSLLIITMSFLPVFTLEAQEGRMFAPLAYTKTYAMAAASALAITLVPVLMGYFIRGRVLAEQANPLNRTLSRAYIPLLNTVLAWPKTTLALALLVTVGGLYPLKHLGSEFVPQLDEGDLMYMPTTYANLSVGKARELLQQTDKLIRTVPEVQNVFGKAGRADSATDPADLVMFETSIQLKPRDQWRPGMTPQKLREELDSLIRFPGLTNAWVPPIKTRIDMLATGIKTPVGIKIAGPDLKVIERIGRDIEGILKTVPGLSSVYAERVAGGRYVKVDIDRARAARYGLNVADVQAVLATAVGGMEIGQTIEGRERYPINLRYPQDYRDSPEALALLPLVTADGARIALGDVARVYLSDEAPMLRSENARLNGWVYVDIDGRDIGSFVAEARARVEQELKLDPGYSLTWSGQYEYMERAKARLTYVVPLTLAIIVLLLYLAFRRMSEVLIILGSLPLAVVGGIWAIWLLGFNLSVAVGVGFIALAGVAVETGVLMLVYLNHAWEDLWARSQPDRAGLHDAVIEGAALRLRPKMMTVVTIIVGLLPIMWSEGTGSEVMQRIAAPMIGGMVTALVLTLLVLPAIYYLWRGRQLAALCQPEEKTQ